jgi:hypothetical protein
MRKAFGVARLALFVFLVLHSNQRETAMRRLMGAVLILAIGMGSVAVATATKPTPAPKTVKEVMKIAHKDGLLKKVTDGDASDEEKKQLLDLYIDMLEGEPAKGEKSAWLMAAGATVVSAAKVVTGREGAVEELKKTTDCKACHSVFK